GKTVRITFVDGGGVTDIEPIDCALSRREQDLIKRTNFVMDHYIFPNKKKAPDEDWDVEGDVFSGFLDPRLEGKVTGKVNVLRTADHVEEPGNEVSRRLKVTKGTLEVRKVEAGREVVGRVTDLRGVCVI